MSELPTADLRFRRSRPGVFIHLLPAHIADIVCQPDVLAAFTTEELLSISEAVRQEIESRS